MSHRFLFRIGLVALVAACTLSGALATAAPGSTLTTTASTSISVGDFLIMYARSVSLSLSPEATGELALQALRGAGVPLPGWLDLSRPLTQADVVWIGQLRGLKLTARTPQRMLGRSDAETFLRVLALNSFTRSLDPVPPARNGGDSRTGAAKGGKGSNPPGDPAGHTPEKGKKKGRPFQASPFEPE